MSDFLLFQRGRGIICVEVQGSDGGIKFLSLQVFRVWGVQGFGCRVFRFGFYHVLSVVYAAQHFGSSLVQAWWFQVGDVVAVSRVRMKQVRFRAPGRLTRRLRRFGVWCTQRLCYPLINQGIFLRSY